jgi:succinyl-diaminopimelate desuccinylase
VAYLDSSLDAVQLTRALCDIESVSGDEQTIADAIEVFLRECPHLDVIRDGNALVARTNLGRAQRVLIAGHIDTVPVNNNLPTRVEGETVWGRGTVDMKAGVAVHLLLAKDLVDPVHDITWIFYDLEEVEASRNGLGRLARNHPELLVGDFAILGEPSNAIIEGGCNGTMRASISTSGVRAHSARAWMGSNAIHAAHVILDRLATYEPRTVTVDGLDYREGLNAVAIRGGVAGNVIPDECVVDVNYRFAPSTTEEEAAAIVTALFPEFDIVVTDSAAGARPGADSTLAQGFIAAVGGRIAPKFGWTDVARFMELGIPAVNFGPGDPALAHADDERVSVSDIVECETGLRAWLGGH